MGAQCGCPGTPEEQKTNLDVKNPSMTIEAGTVEKTDQKRSTPRRVPSSALKQIGSSPNDSVNLRKQKSSRSQKSDKQNIPVLVTTKSYPAAAAEQQQNEEEQKVVVNYEQQIAVEQPQPQEDQQKEDFEHDMPSSRQQPVGGVPAEGVGFISANGNAGHESQRSVSSVVGGKKLKELPDYTSAHAKKVEKDIGPYKFEDNTNDNNKEEFADLIQRDPYELDNGAVFHGQWTQSGLRQGAGIQIWKNGSKYEGFWMNDKANGNGRLIHTDGARYEGEWFDDMAHGTGHYIHPSGASYKGDWQKDKQHGKGTETWPDNSNFVGDFVNGKKHGQGIFNFTDGAVYNGEYLKNDIQGKGTYTWHDGRTYTGKWHNNKMHGEGIFTWEDGRRYVGQYVADKKVGYGVYEWKDGRQFKGNWVNGRQHGFGIYKSKGGSVKEGEWREGKRFQAVAADNPDGGCAQEQETPDHSPLRDSQ